MKTTQTHDLKKYNTTIQTLNFFKKIQDYNTNARFKKKTTLRLLK